MREHLGLKIFIVAVFLVFAAHQIYSSLYKPISTETAEYFEVVSGVSSDAIIIRNEKLIENNSAGALHYITTDGTRAAKGGTIAKIYNDASASGKISRLQIVENELESIKQIEEYNNVQAADMEIINSKVNDALNAVIRSGATGDFSDIPQKSEQLIMSISRRQVVTGELTDFSVQKAALNAELEQLKASIPAPTGEVVADVSGYFVSSTDGYEQQLDTADLTVYTPEYLGSIKPQDVPADTIGKIVSDYEWYIAAEMGINDSLQYKVGDTVTLKADIKSTPELSVTVSCINMSKNADSAVVIFACQQMNGDLATVREVGVTVVNKIYKGLRVPRKALRMVDGKSGVYTVSGMRLKFVTVNVIYNSEDFIICEQEFTDGNVLRLYDEVVTKGKGLKNGKVVS